MAGIRDPAFWKRFSTAVHRDEESNPNTPGIGPIRNGTTSPSSSRPPLKHSDTWLARNAAKRSRLRCIGWSIVCALLVFIAAIVLVILYLKGKLIPRPDMGNGAGKSGGQESPPMESGLVTATDTAVQSGIQGVMQTASSVAGAARTAAANVRF